jgi:hypothetical protein
MARWQSTTYVNTLARGRALFPVISEEFVYLKRGRNCPRQSMSTRCIPLIGARHCRRTFDVCQSLFSTLWIYSVIVGWTTHEIWYEPFQWPFPSVGRLSDLLTS